MSHFDFNIIEPFSNIDYDSIKKIEFINNKESKSTLKQDFFNVLKNQINNVDIKQQHAHKKMTNVEMGVEDDLVGAVMAIQKSTLTFQILLQVRNKLIEGYSELINQQL